MILLLNKNTHWSSIYQYLTQSVNIIQVNKLYLRIIFMNIFYQFLSTLNAYHEFSIHLFAIKIILITFDIKIYTKLGYKNVIKS